MIKKSPKGLFRLGVQFIADSEHKMQIYNLITKYAEQLGIICFVEKPSFIRFIKED